MTNLIDRINEKIQKEEIKPTSKWKFLMKDYFVWSAFATSVIVGGLAFAVIVFLLTNNTWSIHRNLNKSFAEYFLLSIPYFWVLFLGLFSFLAYYNYNHTKKGYKSNPLLIVAVSVALSLVLGVTFSYAGLGSEIENVFTDKFPYYDKIIQKRMEVWNNPEKGLLAGTIEEIESRDEFILEDFDGKEWTIESESIFIPRRVVFEKGMRIKLIGEQKSENVFFANEIKPLIGGEGRSKRLRSGHGQVKGVHKIRPESPRQFGVPMKER